MRAVFAGCALLFVFAATLQYNDPDPVRWMAVYLAGALVAGLAVARRPVARPLAAVVGLIALAWSLTYLPSVVRHGQVTSMFDEWTMRNEEVLQSREMFGLLLVSAVMLTIFLWNRSPHRVPTRPVSDARPPA